MRLPYRRWKALQRVRCLRMNDGNVAGIIRDTKAFLEKYFGLGITELRDEEHSFDIMATFSAEKDGYHAYVQNVDAGVYIIVAKELQIVG